MGGAAWFVRGKLYAWECHPWPSIPADMRAIIAAELVVGVKVAERLDALALVEMEPDVFLRTTTTWGEPKVAFRMAGIDDDHLAELVTEAWRVQAPKYLRRELDDGSGSVEAWATALASVDLGLCARIDPGRFASPDAALLSCTLCSAISTGSPTGAPTLTEHRPSPDDRVSTNEE